ncbi:RsmB/NOP family class I SAM-dependent RNA methyltransferase [Terrihabitans sp. B22-R8]|uniref:RsmB/NOP family class I SAM-dependent RNA methyltransferase n=1 Tax=Terrihabitans sp. B22-R8 TaxID=3425128 RepID=UPI00403C6888
MKAAAHHAAAIEVLAEIATNRRPASDALKDWGMAHRFAGSRDRAAIASLVYDALRHRASLSWRMGDESARALVLGALVFVRDFSTDALEAAFADSPHAPSPLSEGEKAALASGSLEDAPNWVRGDYPEWLDSLFARVFGEDRAEELAALAERAPLDLRANPLKADREKALKALDHLRATQTPLSPFGVRVPLLEDGRGPPVQAEPAFLKGWVEVQDEGSQLAALIAAAAPGEQVIDLCAGAGGKTLALSAGMNNRGQIFAYDRDIRRLAPLHERADRAGVRNLQVRSPKAMADVLADLEGRADLVVVDAPCTGTGTWRRNPDAKWRLRPGAIEVRQNEQDAVLADAARLVKPGGRIAYITCSLLAEENDDRLAAFRTKHPEFTPISAREAAIAANLPALAAFTNAGETGLVLTPKRTGTDGFFVGLLRKTGG